MHKGEGVLGFRVKSLGFRVAQHSISYRMYSIVSSIERPDP